MLILFWFVQKWRWQYTILYKSRFHKLSFLVFLKSVYLLCLVICSWIKAIQFLIAVFNSFRVRDFSLYKLDSRWPYRKKLHMYRSSESGGQESLGILDPFSIEVNEIAMAVIYYWYENMIT